MGYRKYKEIEDLTGKWFLLGFASITASLTVLLITGTLAITTFSVFLFGFLLVYSGAIDEVWNAREFVEILGILLILGSLVIVGIIGLGWSDEIIAWFSQYFP